MQGAWKRYFRDIGPQNLGFQDRYQSINQTNQSNFYSDSVQESGNEWITSWLNMDQRLVDWSTLLICFWGINHTFLFGVGSGSLQLGGQG